MQDPGGRQIDYQFAFFTVATVIFHVVWLSIFFFTYPFSMKDESMLLIIFTVLNWFMLMIAIKFEFPLMPILLPADIFATSMVSFFLGHLVPGMIAAIFAFAYIWLLAVDNIFKEIDARAAARSEARRDAVPV